LIVLIAYSFFQKLKGEYRKVIDEIAHGTRKSSTIKIIHLIRKKKWLFHIPYECEQKKVELKDDRTMLVYPPGNGIFLRCEYKPKTEKIPWREDIESESMKGTRKGYDIKRTRKIYETRRIAVSFKYRQDSDTSAIGHGRKRALKNKIKYEEKYKRACKTFNQQRASHIVKVALRWKCGKIQYVCPDDIPGEGYKFLDSWPWYQLEQCIKNKCDEHGIKFIKNSESKQITEFMQNYIDKTGQA
jgi:hypothetical protein